VLRTTFCGRRRPSGLLDLPVSLQWGDSVRYSPAVASPAPRKLSAEQRALISWTLRVPRGRYPAWRASQLSGVPRSTLYDWVRHDVMRPDFAHPLEWSYRDLIFVRLVAWLRAKDMPRPDVAERVGSLRELLAESDEASVVRSDGRALFLGDEPTDARSGQSVMPPLLSFLDEFDLTAPLGKNEFGRRHMWGPDLLTPSSRSYISPKVMGGEPCVAETRIPTGTIYALHTDRGLEADDIQSLYEELQTDDVEDALRLELRLRHQPVAA
jgi:uncharacterized protein (DUF433 family)